MGGVWSSFKFLQILKLLNLIKNNNQTDQDPDQVPDRFRVCWHITRDLTLIYPGFCVGIG